jgi:hypothetical protein
MSDLYDPQDDVRADALDHEEYRTVGVLLLAETFRQSLRPRPKWVSKLIAALTACVVLILLSGCATAGYGQQTTVSYGPNGYTQTTQGYNQQSGVDQFAQALALVTPYVMPLIYGGYY